MQAAAQRAAVAAQAHLAHQLAQSKFSAPAKALAARVVTTLQKPLIAEPIALALLFAVCVYALRSTCSGFKLYSRAALATAFVNWLTFSWLVNCVTSGAVFILTTLELVASVPLLTLGLCVVANASDLRRLVAGLLPQRKAVAVAAVPAAASPRPAAAPAAAAPAAPAASSQAPRISASGTPDASKVKPGTPVPGAPRPSPGARPAAK